MNIQVKELSDGRSVGFDLLRYNTDEINIIDPNNVYKTLEKSGGKK